jgi:hypothetical protein
MNARHTIADSAVNGDALVPAVCPRDESSRAAIEQRNGRPPVYVRSFRHAGFYLQPLGERRLPHCWQPDPRAIDPRAIDARAIVCRYSVLFTENERMVQR